MDVLRHEDIAEDVEPVFLTDALEGFEEDVAGVVVVQVGEALVTTEGDEVVVTEGVKAFEVARHFEMILDVGWFLWVPEMVEVVLSPS
jgi:hypothetical protein